MSSHMERRPIQRVIKVNLWHKQLNYDITAILQIGVNKSEQNPMLI